MIFQNYFYSFLHLTIPVSFSLQKCKWNKDIPNFKCKRYLKEKEKKWFYDVTKAIMHWSNRVNCKQNTHVLVRMKEAMLLIDFIYLYPYLLYYIYVILVSLLYIYIQFYINYNELYLLYIIYNINWYVMKSISYLLIFFAKNRKCVFT